MRAMVLERPANVETSPLTIQDVTLPIPRPGEVRVQVRCCGVCHTDLHIVEGDLPLPKLPVIPGHQIVGIVDAVGRDIRVIKEGDRVGSPWQYSTEGICGYWRQAFENLGDNAQFTGYHVYAGYGMHAERREEAWRGLGRSGGGRAPSAARCVHSLCPRWLAYPTCASCATQRRHSRLGRSYDEPHPPNGLFASLSRAPDSHRRQQYTPGCA